MKIGKNHFGQMAKREGAGYVFLFSDSFLAMLCYGALLVSGTGKDIALDCVSLVSCFGVGYVCKVVVLEGKSNFWELLQMLYIY